MEEQDFRVGDVVCDYRYGTGKVIDVVADCGNCSVFVEFNKSNTSYSIEGRELNSDTIPPLRHGTWEQNFGNLPTIKPKRKVKRWFNLYRDNNECLDGKYVEYFTKESADILAERSEKKPFAVAVEIEVDE